MIVFDLECSQGHNFEGWFESSEAFEVQNAEDLVRCPYCEDTDIRKIMSPVAVRKAGVELHSEQGPIDYKRLAMEVIDYVQENSEDVGTRFAAEALKMHYGVSEKRSIRGSATSEEERTLQEEGVEYVKLPVLKKDEKDNKN